MSYNGGATNNGGPDFEIAGGQLRTVAGANIDVAKNSSIVLRVSGVVNATAAGGTAIDNTATVRWSSLDGSVAGERTGADGPLNGGSLNDYQRSNTGQIPIANGIRLSRVGGLADSAAANPTTDSVEDVAVGEIVRYRAAVLVPEGSNPNYQVRLELANGLEFILPTGAGDAVLIGMVANNGGLVSNATLITGGTLDVTGNQNSAETLALQPDLSGPTVNGLFDASRISRVINGDGSQTVTFDLGSLTNQDGADADLEGVVLEFNVRVSNQASNAANVQLAATLHEHVNGVDRGTSATLYERIVEPAFADLDKRVVSFNPGTAGSTGQATVQISFRQSGGLPAYDVSLDDAFPGGSNYTLVSLKIGSTTYTAGNLPAGVTAALGSGLHLGFDKLDVGTQVTAVYRVDVPNGSAIASTDAALTWSSLPESFTTWGGASVGTDGQADGERTGSGTGPNTYVLREGAGLGLISGTLWNDTASADGSTTPDGPGLAGQTVTLTWAGADGDLATAADNLVYTTTTDGAGQYHFGVLPAGTFRIDVPTTPLSYPQPVGELRLRIDSDAGSALGSVVAGVGEGASVAANAGYVERNDAPVNTVPGQQSGSEDTPLAITGLSVDDVDADRDPNAADRALQIVLDVSSGTLSLSSTPGGVTVAGSGTNTLTLTGTQAVLRTALANLVYLGNQDFNGTDTLRMQTNDRGNFGDLDGDGTPGEATDDALTDTDPVRIVLAAVNDAPTAHDDTAAAIEAGGTANAQAGLNPRGNLLGNDTDVDIATNGDVLSVKAAGVHGTTQQAILAGGSVSIQGTYGTLVVLSTGAYDYLVDNANPLVQALRTSGQTLSEQFDYTMADVAGVSSSATLTVTIAGANDAPVGVNDSGSATEAGGVLNGSGGSDATGAVLANDTDVDTVPNGESRSVIGIRTLRETVPGAFTAVTGGTTSANGTVVAGTYGSLTIGADGSYRYVVDNTNTAVQRMVAGETLNEYFSYVLEDAGGLNDVAELRIVINGAADAPVASDDQAAAQAASTNNNAQESNPQGNVILFPSRPGSVTQPGGNGVDTDVDRPDRPSTQLRLSGARTGTELAGGALTAVAAGTTSANGTVLVGQYGTLRIGANGSFFYDVDSTNAAVQNLQAGQTLTEAYTYEIVDQQGLSDQAQLLITVRGVNDPPVPQDVVAEAIERGGAGNATAGVDPSGDVTTVAFDPDGDELSVTFIRPGDQAAGGTATSVSTSGVTTVNGTYGQLGIRADGSYTYTLFNNLPAVEALRTDADDLVDVFTFTIDDAHGETDQAELIVQIRGRNDSPVAADDAASATEASGVDNGTPGADPSGNVLDNDDDVDGGEKPADPIDYGETMAVTTVRTGSEAGTGAAGALGSELRGAYGWLTLAADGTYSYRLDNAMAEVQALDPGDTLTDAFSYTIADADGATDRATLTITIGGANDTRTANDDSALAIEAGGIANGTPGVDPSGNVLSNDTDVDGAGETVTILAYRQGGSVVTAGNSLAGRYGTLTLRADGSYDYVVDNANPDVQAQRLHVQHLDDTFIYASRDSSGDLVEARLTIIIEGRNDTPQAADDTAVAVEAGGVANGTPGSNPSGNLLTNDTDVDGGDTRTLDGIRTGTEAAGGSFTTVGTTASVVAGQYGTLTVGADGQFQYALNNGLAAVQALKAGDTLTEDFTYRIRDAAGLVDTAQLTLTIRGAWDTPVATNDQAYAVAAVQSGSSGRDPAGNVLANDTDVDLGDVLSVGGIRTGTEAAGGALIAVNAGTTSANGTLVTGTSASSSSAPTAAPSTAWMPATHRSRRSARWAS